MVDDALHSVRQCSPSTPLQLAGWLATTINQPTNQSVNSPIAVYLSKGASTTIDGEKPSRRRRSTAWLLRDANCTQGKAHYSLQQSRSMGCPKQRYLADCQVIGEASVAVLRQTTSFLSSRKRTTSRVSRGREEGAFWDAGVTFLKMRLLTRHHTPLSNVLLRPRSGCAVSTACHSRFFDGCVFAVMGLMDRRTC